MKTRVFPVLAIIFLMIFVFSFFIIRKTGYIFGKKESVLFAPTSTPSPDPFFAYNMLLLGYGGVGHEGGMLTDTIIIGHIIPKKKKIILVSIPRDLFLPLPTKNGEIVKKKINEFYEIGQFDIDYPAKSDVYKGKGKGGLLVSYGINYATGLSPKHIIGIDFTGFTKIIDKLGGIEVDVPYSFEDEFYPIKGKEKDTCGKREEEIKSLTATLSGSLLEEQFTCRFEKISFISGKRLMDGETALKFIRSRHSKQNGGDFGRSLRQQAVIKAFKEKITNPNMITKIIPLFQELSKYFTSDISIFEIGEMLRLYGDIRNFQISSLVLSDSNILEQKLNDRGQYVLVPKTGDDNWEDVHLFIKREIEKIKEE